MNFIIAQEVFWAFSPLPIFVSGIFVYPHNPVYITSLMPPYWHHPLLLLVLAIIYLGIGTSVVSMYVIHSQMVAGYTVHIIPLVTTEFKLPPLTSIYAKAPNKNSYLALNQLRKLSPVAPLSPFVLEYRALEVITTVAIQLYGNYVIPFQSMSGSLCTLYLYIVVRHWGEVGLEIKAFFSICNAALFGFWVAILYFGAIYYRGSLRTIGSWKRFQFLRGGYNSIRGNWEKRYAGRFARSCRPLRIGHFRYYRISHMSALLFLQGCLRATLRVLLALK